MESITALKNNRGLFLKIERQVFTHQNEFEETYHKSEPPVKPSFLKTIKANSCCSCSAQSFYQCLKRIFPILVWLPKYSWRNQFAGDVVSGCTVAIMHIPQGLGYALLGGVSPIVGIYMAFFPVLVYVFLGTSHHISLGTFAVTTLMTGKVVDQYAMQDAMQDANSTTNLVSNETNILTSLEVATAVCLAVGLWQILMCIFRLGILGIILSDHLVSGFTTAAAVHVVVSQTKNLVGIKVPRFNGTFKLIYSVVNIFRLLPTANLAEVIISAITIIVLAVHNDWIKPWYSKMIKSPIPIELFMLVLGTIVSYFGNINRDYSVQVLDSIPTGLPIPRSPPYELLPRILIDSLGVAVVAFAISLSMAKIFARKRNYKISNNQELLAQGVANVFGSFFSCMPISASLSRSMLQESVGGETQLASVVSCLLLMVILLWIGPFFESLPLSILASVIVVALKGMFVQFKDFTSALKLSPLDALVWMVTFVTVVLIDIDIGLAIGVVASICVLIYRGHRPYAAILGRLPGTEMHVDMRLFPAAVEVPGIKIFRWAGAIHFANAEAFRRVLDKHMSSSPCPATTSSSHSDAKETLDTEDQRTKYGVVDEHDSQPLNYHDHPVPVTVMEHLILDCSALSYVDLTGTKILGSLHTDLAKEDITLHIAGCSEPVLQQLNRCLYFHEFPKAQVYPSVIDAVLSIQQSNQPIAEPFNTSDVP